MPVRTAAIRDADAIMDIYNTSLEGLPSSFPYRPFTRESAAEFIEDRRENRGLVLVWEEEGRIGGFAEYAPFQDWKTEEAIADYGLYIRKDCRRKGLGKKLLCALAAAARENGYDALMAVIDPANVPSLFMHEKLNFTCIGAFCRKRESGEMLETVFYEKDIGELLEDMGAAKNGEE
jgi:L-amino acid N-acyltransferase YncA